MPIAPPTGCGFHPAPYATLLEMVEIKLRLTSRNMDFLTMIILVSN